MNLTKLLRTQLPTSNFIFMKKTETTKITLVNLEANFRSEVYLQAIYAISATTINPINSSKYSTMLEISLVNDVRSLGSSNTVSVCPIWFNLDRVDKIEI